MSQFPNRAALWLNKLAPDAPLMSGLCPSVQVADGQINGENVRFIAVVPMLTTTTRVPPAAKLACWKAGRWRKWLMKPLPPTPTSQSNGRSSP